MGSSYEHLSFDERRRIAELFRAGYSRKKIAAALGRSAPTIGREVKRNAGSQTAGYRADYAEQLAKARRWIGARLERDAPLRERVLADLALGHSPAQIAGRLAREQGRPIIGHESIYRFIYAQMKRTNDSTWRNYLPRAKTRRGWRGKKGGSPASLILQRVSIDQRPLDAADRRQAGHWEADFMLFAQYGHQILVLHERTSRLTALLRTTNRQAKPTANALARLLRPLPKAMRRSLTFDNGTEFAEHHRLNRKPGLQTFFCDPYAPWQKGGVENAIGRMRRFLPRKTNLQDLGPDQLLSLARAYNHTPRQCLDFQTPAEVFSKLLHFEWESTSRLAGMTTG
jgi:transposase, IS30 family